MPIGIIFKNPPPMGEDVKKAKGDLNKAAASVTEKAEEVRGWMKKEPEDGEKSKS